MNPVIPVYSVASAHHDIDVSDHGPLRVLRFTRNRQSTMYLDAPFDTDFEYPAYFHIALALQPEATRTLVIGLGGGSVVKRMWRDYPEMHIDAVEIDPDVVHIARRYFELPDDERIGLHVDDGRRFLEACPDTYGIVMVDAFDEDRVPRQLTTEEFLRTVRDRLEPEGVVAYNFIGAIGGDRSKPFRSLYRTLRNAWRHVWVFAVDEGVESDGANLMLFATDASVSADVLRDRIADRVGGRVTVPAFHLFGADLYTGEIRCGDVPILVDPPTSPRPPARRL